MLMGPPNITGLKYYNTILSNSSIVSKCFTVRIPVCKAKASKTYAGSCSLDMSFESIKSNLSLSQLDADQCFKTFLL